MSSSSSHPSWAVLGAWTALAWLGISGVMAVQDATLLEPQALVRAWLFTAPRCVPGLALTLVVFALARLAPVRGSHWKRRFAFHAGAALVLVAGGIAVQQALLRALRPEYADRVSFVEGWRAVLRERGALALMLYAGLVGIYQALSGAVPTESSEASTEDGSVSAADSADDHFLVRSGDTLVPVPVAEVEWIEAADSYVRLHLADGDTYLHRTSMRATASRLADRPFLRIHRSTIVRLDAVDRLETPAATDHYTVVLRDGTRRRVSRSYQAALLEALGASS